MKKFLLMAVAAFGMLMTACSKDEVAQPVGGEESVVTFTISTPELATRTEHGDGLTATVLKYAVYNRVDGSKLFEGQPATLTNKTATVEIPFVNGMEYDVLFWAEAPASPYTVNFDAKTVAYTNAAALVSNSEAYDAFYAYVNDIPEITGPVTKSVELKRPFAQLNIITNDAAEAAQSGVVVEDVKVVVEGAYTDFDLANHKGLTKGTVTFDTAAAQTTTDVLAVNYLFPAAEKSLVDVEFTYTDVNGKLAAAGEVKEFATVPIQRNYRTNIVGSLLTSDGVFNVEIEEGFDGTETFDAPSEWDGVSTETPTADANGVIRINSAEEFVGLMEVTGNSIFSGKTILLELDIDLKGNAIKGIGGDSNFAGVFDGQGHTVSNFTLDATHRNYYAGLFNQVSHGGTIKNLTVKNATIKGKSMVGAVASSLDSNATVENCKAIGCTLIGVKKVGSVVGYSAGSTVKGNYAENCTIVFSEKEAGEVLGYENTGSTVEGNTFENINIVKGRVYGSLILAPNGTNSQIIVRDKEGLLKLTDLFANWAALFTDGNGETLTNYANGAGTDFYYSSYWTINLVADIDLNNETIDPIIIKHPVSIGASVFNGNNHLIKNAKIVTNPATQNAAGLFDASTRMVMKNLKLDSIHVTGSNVGNSNAGILSGVANENVQNITITNSSVTGGKYTGGVVGSGYTNVLNCELNNVVVKGGYKLGGIIGYICASGSSTGDVTDNTLTDCEVNGIGGGVYAGGKSEYIIGKLVGNYNCNGTCQNNTVVNMTTDATSNIGKIEAGFSVVE